ncbi:hypothetical protein SCP_0200650 [Sparassis crispa]|uniref:Uncharacterized protein n=1 Tax=Sparassis crispa TaxID=139825 RepID=A0A401G9N3_9APHY|nr:hypothetical protein SCP_0200650 [Sparassis crispa]GBE78868.1 hypothetical protein SCP_0200650 [Sparassis crispa]
MAIDHPGYVVYPSSTPGPFASTSTLGCLTRQLARYLDVPGAWFAKECVVDRAVHSLALMLPRFSSRSGSTFQSSPNVCPRYQVKPPAFGAPMVLRDVGRHSQRDGTSARLLYGTSVSKASFSKRSSVSSSQGGKGASRALTIPVKLVPIYVITEQLVDNRTGQLHDHSGNKRQGAPQYNTYRTVMLDKVYFQSSMLDTCKEP